MRRCAGTWRRMAGAALLACALAAAGCGLGAGDGPGREGADIHVTRDFGAEGLEHGRLTEVPAGETVMRALQRLFDVETRFGGGFVQSIEGLEGGEIGGRPRDWFFYVNGIESETGATSRELAGGEHVWWDHHDWGTTMRVPAVVGAFPQPFLSGIDGKRIPIRLDCAPGAERPCDEVARRLEEAEVTKVSRGNVGTVPGNQTLRILVGRWSDVRRDLAAAALERGPAASGVFARPARDGSAIDLLDERGEVARRLGAGGGLVAATRYQDQQPMWFVVGVDDAGVQAAAGLLHEEALEQRFAVAADEGVPVPLPVPLGPEERVRE